MALKIRRGLEADRSSITPEEGEFLYVTDTGLVYIGDGTTAGGNLIAGGGGGIDTATASGTNTYTATITGVTAYATHDIYEIIFTNANTGSSTININSLGAKTLKKGVSTNLASGDIPAGKSYFIVYDGTNFQVIGIASGGTAATTSFSPAGNIAATDVQSAIEELDTEKQTALGFTPENVSNKSDSYTVSSSTTYASTKAVVDGLATKQASLGYTAENQANKENTTIDTNTTKYPTVNLLKTGLDTKQAADATLTALAGLATGANKIPYSTGTDTFGQLDLSTSNTLGTSDTTIPTQKAIKEYVDSKVITESEYSKIQAIWYHLNSF